jgi:hypothetical protein
MGDGVDASSSVAPPSIEDDNHYFLQPEVVSKKMPTRRGRVGSATSGSGRLASYFPLISTDKLEF